MVGQPNAHGDAHHRGEHQREHRQLGGHPKGVANQVGHRLVIPVRGAQVPLEHAANPAEEADVDGLVNAHLLVQLLNLHGVGVHTQDDQGRVTV